MKYILLLVGFVFISATQTKKLYNVSISLTTTSQYCGGAAPSREMIEELSRPVPDVAKKMILKRGIANDSKSVFIKEFTANDTGYLFMKLPAGKYFLIIEDKKDKTFYNDILKNHKVKTEQNEAVDIACLNKWYLTPDFSFEVKANQSKQKFTYNTHHNCNYGGNKPCVLYTGPLPP
jgi:hypothetical protein